MIKNLGLKYIKKFIFKCEANMIYIVYYKWKFL